MNVNNHRKYASKFYSNYTASIYNINSLLEKMNSLKNLMYHTTDLNSILIMDQYGLKYSTDLRKNINSAKKLMSPHSSNSKKVEKSDTFFKSNNNQVNINYYKGINIMNNFRNKNKKFRNKLIDISRDFDLTNISNISKIKRNSIKDFLDQEKKDKTLYHLKTELFLLEQKNKLNDLYNSDNKTKKNLTFIRDDKENHYSQIKSKFMKNTLTAKNKRKKNLLLTMYKPNNINKLNSLSKTVYNDNNNTIKIKINENNSDNNNINTSETEKSIKRNKKLINLRDKINSYKVKQRISKSNKSVNNNIFLTNTNNINNSKYILETPEQTSPNLSIFKNNVGKCKTTKKINKISFTHLTNSNNSQENTSLNSLNSSLISNVNKINYRKKNISLSNLNNPKKINIINHINNIMKKSNRIRRNFINNLEEAKKAKSKMFSKHNYNYKLNSKININKINNFFKFSKREDIDENQLIKDNANKVKTILDKKCSKILDNIIKEMLYKDRKLHKEYLGMSSYEKKMMKIKRENDIKKISNDHVLMEKEMEKDKILDSLIPENEEIIKLIKEDKITLNDSIEKIYAKSMVLKHLQN